MPVDHMTQYSVTSPDHMMYMIIAVNYTTVYKDITSCASEDVNNIKWISL